MKLWNRSRKLPKNLKNFTIDDRLSMIDKIENAKPGDPVTFTSEELYAYTEECSEYAMTRERNILTLCMGGVWLLMGLGAEIIDRVQNRKK